MVYQLLINTILLVEILGKIITTCHFTVAKNRRPGNILFVVKFFSFIWLFEEELSFGTVEELVKACC